MARPWGMLAIAMAVALAGCAVQVDDEQVATGSNPASAPVEDSLSMGGGISDVCADGTSHRAFVYGVPITNLSDDGVYLTSGGLESPDGGIELIDMWVVGPEVGVDDPDASVTWSADYPPDTADIPGWADRVDLDQGAVSAHSTTWVAFAVQLVKGAETGSAGMLRITYRGPDGTATVTDQGTYGIGRIVDGAVSCAP